MLAIISQKLVNADYLLDFRQLAKTGKVAKGRKPGHSDGWGLVAYESGLPMYLGRQPNDAYSDPEYERACKTLEDKATSGIIFCQLRKRSAGKKNVNNTPPFALGNLCLMHNGTVHKLGNENESDTIQLLRMIAHQVAEGRSILDSLRTVYSEVSKKYRYTSLTSVVTDGKSVFATKCVNSSQDAECYDLMYATIRDHIVISQEKTWQLDWTTVENGKVAIFSRDLEISIQKLFQS